MPFRFCLIAQKAEGIYGEKFENGKLTMKENDGIILKLKK